MELSESVKTEKTVIIDGVEISVDGFLKANAHLKYNNNRCEPRHREALFKMKEAGLVDRKKRKAVFGSKGGYIWKRDSKKCQEVYNMVVKTYCLYKIQYGRKTFDTWDESEVENAEQKAKEHIRELEERNPDVEWELKVEEKEMVPE